MIRRHATLLSSHEYHSTTPPPFSPDLVTLISLCINLREQLHAKRADNDETALVCYTSAPSRLLTHSRPGPAPSPCLKSTRMRSSSPLSVCGHYCSCRIRKEHYCARNQVVSEGHPHVRLRTGDIAGERSLSKYPASSPPPSMRYVQRTQRHANDDEPTTLRMTSCRV